ncbi:MAG: quinone oxidoreductase [Acidobacteriia bacterium]|nr:quinone oxidoreductase [Terriglobia bacterium]
MKALCFSRFGGPDVLEYLDVPDPIPAAGQARVRMKAIGMNFADIYRRRGNYHLEGTPPWILGYEGAGVVETAAGPFAAGDRVAFADAPMANAALVCVPADKLVPLPDDVPFETAAALLLQGLTAHYLVHDSYALRAGDEVLVHAAAGGVGLLLAQIAAKKGARVVGLVSAEGKRAAVRAAGASAVVLYGEEWALRARAETPFARGFDVVYDSVGSTLRGSLRAAKIGGHVVFYGMSGGDPEPVDPRLLMDESKTLTGGDLWNVLTSHDERVRRAGELFAAVRRGELTVTIGGTFALADGRRAHETLEGRGSIGKLLLLP